MVEPPSDLVVEILRRIQGDLAQLKDDMRSVQRTLAAMESHMAGFHPNIAGHSDETTALKVRVDRIERRLDLVELT